MARLSIHLLGAFQVELDGDPVTGFKSDRVRALLAFLAVEADQPHARDLLAWLLYPDSPNRAARTNFRSLCANLRRVILDQQASPPHLIVDRHSAQFNLSSDHWLDVYALCSLPDVTRIDTCQVTRFDAAVRRYRGPFLSGFSIRDSEPFEEWLLLKRERITRRVLAALTCLATYHEQRAEFEEALAYAWKAIELEPACEDAQRLLIRLLAEGGHRCAAMQQFETCRKVLARELRVEPSRETTLLFEAIRDERLGDMPNQSGS